jgi:lon-related putative ATP-dependent protease
MGETTELRAAELYQRCDPQQFSFETTDEVEDLSMVIGQPRAVDAMEFGVGIDQAGYNIFALGSTGTGKRSVVHRYFERQARSAPVPFDWCYVNNFEEPHQPNAIELPAGKGLAFRKDMEELIDGISTALSAAFESEEYQSRRQSMAGELQEQQSEAFQDLQQKAQDRGVALLRTPAGLAFAPVRDGEVLSGEEVQKLSEEERERLEGEVETLQQELQKILLQVPSWQRETQEKLRKLNREMAQFAVGGLIDELQERYSEFSEIVDFLDAVQEDIVENARDILQSDEQEGNLPAMLRGAAGQGSGGRSPLMRRYQVNLLVDHSQSEGAPVIHEDNPTYQNLIGRVEHRAQMGALLTDFNLIKAGALHKANGGYLILDARKVLTQPYAWEGLKRTLQSSEVRIESVGQMLSLISTISLEPEAIPLNVKVAMVGEPLLYYMLHALDPEFADLFKVQADFEETMDRNVENQELYAQMLATWAKNEDLRPFERSAIARIIERSARIVGDSEKLSMRRRDITDLLREANYWAGKSGNGVVSAADVQKAIDAQIYRADRLRERVQESIQRDIVLIDTTGEKVGQVNGLSVLQLGNFSFGRPSRITARVRLGKGDVLNIDREVELSGPIHSKGVLILSGFLRGRYAESQPLSLSASLVFEQSYGGVEGDSASSAELYALLSAIGEVPIKQSLAVTGSVNQHGQVQAIGGVNEKIEGFFDICKARGLTGEQGVLVPVSNVQHLMLRQDVVDAVEEGKFHVYAVTTIDEGIEILTGLPAGEPDEEGRYPEGSVNYLVQARLAEMAEKRKAFAAPAGKSGAMEEEA